MTTDIKDLETSQTTEPGMAYEPVLSAALFNILTKNLNSNENN